MIRKLVPEGLWVRETFSGGSFPRHPHFNPEGQKGKTRTMLGFVQCVVDIKITTGNNTADSREWFGVFHIGCGMRGVTVAVCARTQQCPLT